MSDSHSNVHAAHCCSLHGCKYGDDDCPVVSGKIKQYHICIDCEEQGIVSLDKMEKSIKYDKQSKDGICYVNTFGLSDLEILEKWINIQVENSDKNGQWIHIHDLINVIDDIKKGGL